MQGGYNLDSISNSAVAVAQAMLGNSPPPMPPLVASEDAVETVWQVAHTQSKYWKSIIPQSCEPTDSRPIAHCYLPLIMTRASSRRRRYLSNYRHDSPFHVVDHIANSLSQSCSRDIDKISCSNTSCFPSPLQMNGWKMFSKAKFCARMLFSLA
jgi:hypothetical protein